MEFEIINFSLLKLIGLPETPWLPFTLYIGPLQAWLCCLAAVLHIKRPVTLLRLPPALNVNDTLRQP